MARFKEGDKAKVAREKYGHEFEIGLTVTIKEVTSDFGENGDSEYIAYRGQEPKHDEDWWFVRDDELEEI